MILYLYPPNPVSVTVPPIAFTVDGVPVGVNIDTGTPANSTPLPVTQLGPDGLPVDYSTEAKQDDQIIEAQSTNTKLDTLNSKDFATEATLALLEGKDFATSAKQDDEIAAIGTLLTDTQLRASPVDVALASMPLASGAATEAKQDDEITAIGLLLTDTQLRASAVPVSLASAPLASGAATEAKQDTVNTNTTNIPNVIAPEGGTQSSHILQIGGHNGSGVSRHIRVSNTGIVHVDVQASVLPNGAATEATSVAGFGSMFTEQGNTNALLTSIDGKVPATLGTKTVANSFAVTLASDQPTINVATGSPTAVTVKQAAITVGTSAVRCTTDGSAPSSTRQRLMIQPIQTSVANFYMGSSSVTSSSTTRGIQIFPGQVFEALNDANDYYIISDTASQTVFVTEAE